MKMLEYIHRIALLTVLFCISCSTTWAENWPSWRGPQGNGHSSESPLIDKWSAKENVLWRTPLPERGNSSAVIWGDAVFITQSMEKEHRRTLMCFSAVDGKLLWQSGVPYEENDSSHETNPFCSSSPVTDGERVYCWFGSAGVHCFDFTGKKLWSCDLGKQSHEFGYGGSPILYGDVCIVPFGPGKRSFLAAINKKDGKISWQTNEPAYSTTYNGPPGTFTTPSIIRLGAKDYVMHTWSARLALLDPLTGIEQAFASGLDQQVLCSPIFGEGVAVALGGYQGKSIAVQFAANEQGQAHMKGQLWENKFSTLCTGIIHQGHAYLMKMNGSVSCLELSTGKVIWNERLAPQGTPGNSWSSLLLADGKLYAPTQNGTTYVFRPAPVFELLSSNAIEDEHCNASLSVSGGRFFLRTDAALWCFGVKK
jgi:outer membrane protein assembly factor BamB